MRPSLRLKVSAAAAVLLVLAGIVTPQQPKAIDISKPDALKTGMKGRLKGKFEVFAVRPIKKFADNVQIKVSGKFVEPNYLNGTVKLNKALSPSVLLKLETKGKEVGDEVEFDGAVSVERHFVESAVDVDGKLVKVVNTVILLTPVKGKAKK